MNHPLPPARGPLTLTPIGDGVQRVHSADGQAVGHLKRIGAVWKFKAVGTDADGAVVPGGGPLTGAHNTVFDRADAALLNQRLGHHLRASPATGA
jgi:hypothetical protein